MANINYEEVLQTWLGTSMADICKGKGPWHFSTSPIHASKYHHVLYELPVLLKEPPQPHYNSEPKHWDDDFVKMPYSPHSLFLVTENGQEVIKPRWDIICESLSRPILSADDLENAIKSYNTKLPKFTALNRFLTEVLEEDESEYFFSKLLPEIVKLALRLPEFIPGSIPLLKKNQNKSISLSQLQVACLLANAFLCTFIWRKDMVETYPAINFVRLFTANDRKNRQSCVAEKFKCIIHYFRKVTMKHPVGVITFERKFLPKKEMARWDNLDINLGNTKVHITSSGTIEEGLGMLQVDFANKFIGGGVLGYGSVQEEIRFVICPELIISRLFTEQLGDGEAVVITGAERFSKYSGYSNTFKWDDNFHDETPFDEFGQRKTTIAVIDATRYNKNKDQFHCSTILRELNKAYVGFSSRHNTNLSPVATGNWGCGAFKGDPNLKSLIQLMACSASGRDLVYYSFGNTELRDELYNMYMFLATNKITICQLWRYLCRFCASNMPQDKLYSFVQQCHFDMKTQPTLKQFFSFSSQKRKTEPSQPSTSISDEEISRTKRNSIQRNQGEANVKKSQSLNLSSPVKSTEIENNKKKLLSSDDIIHIIDLIDGNVNKTNETSVEPTLLESIDKMKKSQSSNGNLNVCSFGTKTENTVDATEICMEVDDDDDMTSAGSFIEDKKRKITDYFTKMGGYQNTFDCLK